MKTTRCTRATILLAGLLPLQLVGEKVSGGGQATPPASLKELSGSRSPATDLYQKQASAYRDLQRGKAKASGLQSRSTILSDGRYWTMVPKGAVLMVPSKLKGRVKTKSTGKFLAWQQFYLRNRGWVHCYPVQIRQARGEQVITKNALEGCRQTGRVTVAVLGKDPVSVSERALKASR
jgi:hypothetical protein